MPNSTLYIMCGLPFSGKTTFSHAIADQCGFVHLDMDALAKTKGFSPEAGIDDKRWGQLFTEVYQHISSLLSSGKSVVFDAVNYDRAGRNRLRDIAHQNGSSVYVIFINLPTKEIERRRQMNRDNKRRPHVRDIDFINLAKEFDIPTTDENLMIYDGTQAVTEWIRYYIIGANQP